MWSRLTGAASRFCFWGLVAAIVAAGGLGLLSAVDAAFLILGVILFGVACVFRQAARSPPPEPDAPEPAAPAPPSPAHGSEDPRPRGDG